MIGFVIPVYKDVEVLKKTIPEINRLYPNSKIIVVADDIESMIVAKDLGAFVPYHAKRMGFSKSLCEGMCLAWFTFQCDPVIICDGDHPISAVADFLNSFSFNTCDVAVGYERGVWKKSRVWSNMLVNKLLVSGVANPTCGFVAFKSSVLSKLPWDKMGSEYDMIHPELLYYAKKNGAVLGSTMFAEVPKIRYYAPQRYISWLASFIRMVVIKNFN
jgi:hypothetical protein